MQDNFFFLNFFFLIIPLFLVAFIKDFILSPLMWNTAFSYILNFCLCLGQSLYCFVLDLRFFLSTFLTTTAFYYQISHDFPHCSFSFFFNFKMFTVFKIRNYFVKLNKKSNWSLLAEIALNLWINLGGIVKVFTDPFRNFISGFHFIYTFFYVSKIRFLSFLLVSPTHFWVFYLIWLVISFLRHVLNSFM